VDHGSANPACDERLQLGKDEKVDVPAIKIAFICSWVMQLVGCRGGETLEQANQLHRQEWISTSQGPNGVTNVDVAVMLDQGGDFSPQKLCVHQVYA